MSTPEERVLGAGGDRRGRRLVLGAAASLVIALAAPVLAGLRIVSPDIIAAPETTAAAPCSHEVSGPADYGVSIISTGRHMGIPQRGIVAGLIAAQRETGMRNVANPRVPESLAMRHDGLALDNGQAVGLFLQGPDWGSVVERMTPSMAAHRFFDALQKIAGWQHMPEAVAAQAVQRAAFLGPYADEVPAARTFYRQHESSICG
ncbi:hypothetical protein LT337_32155 (plasmid) [Mycolicibacterium fortuitum]|nr:hypothetical protein LT337_32155 [Mycolicibacterium fortuitum]